MANATDRLLTLEELEAWSRPGRMLHEVILEERLVEQFGRELWLACWMVAVAHLILDRPDDSYEWNSIVCQLADGLCHGFEDDE